jgi:Pentapeptide repeats (8 copies)
VTQDDRQLELAAARRDLTADCSRCVGLCCVLPAFAASADFAVDKPAGTPCRHLRADDRCGIHDRLRDRGFPGCVVFDCFGAGQRVTQDTFAGRSWRDGAGTAAAMAAVFPVMRQLTELLWYLAEARVLVPAGPLRTAVEEVAARTSALTRAPAAELAALDIGASRQAAGELLGRVSEAARADVPGRAPDRRGADLIGARLRGASLRGASLRGAYLLGADLRGADLSGADLSTALYLTRFQVRGARGDGATRLPDRLERPEHWPTGDR